MSTVIWEEYKYRHDLCWRLLFQVTAVAVTLSIIPYAAPYDTIVKLGAWLLLVPALAYFVAFFGLLWMQLELRHFAAVDTEYIKYRSERSGQAQWNEYGSFPFVVNTYLIGILLLSVLNLFVAIEVSLPAQLPAAKWTPAVLHSRVVNGFACGIGLGLLARGILHIPSLKQEKNATSKQEKEAILQRTMLLFLMGLLIWGGLTLLFVLFSSHFEAPKAGSLPWVRFIATSLYALIGVGILLDLELALVDDRDRKAYIGIVLAWVAKRNRWLRRKE